MPLMHCHAGEGRAGTLASTISAYKWIIGGYHSTDAIQTAVLNLKKVRPCIHGLVQYKSVYAAVKILLEEDKIL